MIVTTNPRDPECGNWTLEEWQTYIKILNALGFEHEIEIVGGVVYPTKLDKFIGRGYLIKDYHVKVMDEA